MTCGEVWRKMVEAVNGGQTLEGVAADWGRERHYVRNVMRRYRRDGDKIFCNNHKYHDKLCDKSLGSRQDAVGMAVEEMMSARNGIEAVRRKVKVGAVIRVERSEGQGVTKRTEVRKIKIEYVGGDYVMGRTDDGVKMTASFFDLWKQGYI